MISRPFAALPGCSVSLFLSLSLSLSLSLALSLPVHAEEKPSPAPPQESAGQTAPGKETNEPSAGETKKKPPVLMPWEQEQAAMQEKLKQIILPSVELRETPLKDAVKLLTAEARKHDPKGKGVDIALKLDVAKPAAKAGKADKTKKTDKADKDAPTPAPSSAPAPADEAPSAITLTLKDVTLAEALKMTADLSGAHLEVDGKGATFLSKAVYKTELVERTWKIDAEAFKDADGKPLPFPTRGKATSVQPFMEMRGITFGPGALAHYNPKTSLLTVKTTREQFEVVHFVVDFLRAGEDQSQDATPPAPDNEAPEANPPQERPN